MYTHHQSRYETSAGVFVQNPRRVQQDGVALGGAAGEGGINPTFIFWWILPCQTPERLQLQVIASSAGNHAQGVAFAARHMVHPVLVSRRVCRKLLQSDPFSTVLQERNVLGKVHESHISASFIYSCHVQQVKFTPQQARAAGAQISDFLIASKQL